jgi:hypothetical protein
MLFQETTPDTSAYMIAGYVVFAVIMGVYLVSLRIRQRNLKRDLVVLQAMRAESRVRESNARLPRRSARKPLSAGPKAGQRRQGKKKSAAKK